MERRTIHILGVAVILLGAVFLRLHGLSAKPVWYDEAVSIAAAEKGLDSFLSSCRVNYKPLYFFMLHQWLGFVGENAGPLRLLSVLFGVLNVFLVYRLARILFDRKTAYVSAFLLSISVFHIVHCQQIRQNSLVALLATASVYFLTRYVKTSRWRDLVFLSVANIALINTYPTGYSVVLFECLFVFLHLRGESLLRWMISQAVLIPFVLGSLIVVDPGHVREMAWWIAKPGLPAMVETFFTFAWGGPRYGLDDFWTLPQWAWLMLPLSFIYAAAFWGGCKKVLADKTGTALILYWLIVPVALLFILSYLGKPSFFAIKHTIVSLPAFYILAAAGLVRLPPPWRIFALTVILIFNLLPLQAMYHSVLAPDWPGTVKYLKENIKKNDAVIISSLSELVVFSYYFENKERRLSDMDIYGRVTPENDRASLFESGDKNLILGVKQTGFGDSSITAESDFIHHVSKIPDIERRTVWVLLSRWADSGIRPVIFGFLEKKHRPKECRFFSGVEACRFSPQE